MIKGAIFDIDGTIIDSMEIWHNLGKDYLNNLGIKAEENLGDILFELTLDMGVQYIIDNYDLDKSKEEVMNEISNLAIDYYINRSELKTNAKEILEYLYEKDIKMVVASSTERYCLEKAFKRLDIDRYFERIFTCPETGKTKSYPDIFIEAENYLSVPRENIWVFEDALYSINTAKKLGFKIVGIYDEISKNDQDEIIEKSDIYGKDLESVLIEIKKILENRYQ
ncbi:MAG: HAD family phosphatase [Andreesenia angusta]|nr:HAD family phosphatase [Andreesenia angusta]